MLGLNAQDKLLTVKLLTSQKQQQESLMTGNYIRRQNELEGKKEQQSIVAVLASGKAED